MSLLPGVPDVGPKPVSPTISGGAKISQGAPQGIAATANSVGKPGNTEHLGSIIGRTGKGLTSAGGGDPAMHSMSHYGKNAPSGLGGGVGQPAGGVDPTSHGGMSAIRGGSMGKHVRKDGLGAGKTGMPAAANYQPTTQDTE